MALSRYKLGDLIEHITDTNSDLIYGENDVMGMTITKEIIPTKADINGTDLSKFLVVKPGEFIYNPRTHGKRIGFGYNSSSKPFIISWNNIAFRIKKSMKKIVLSDYLFLHFKRDEWDREACFQSWGSSTEVFSWNTLCEMSVELPSILIQKKYVDVYNSLVLNQQSYESGLNDLKFSCEACIQYLNNCKNVSLGNYIKKNTKRNRNEQYTKEEVRGFNNEGEFIKPMRLFSGKISTFKILSEDDFVYNSRINSTITKLSIAFNEDKELIVSPAYESFYVSKKDELDPYYLYMLLQRENFARKVLFNSFGSSTLVFSLDDLSKIEIPLPDIKVQRAIATLYKSYKERKQIYEKLKLDTKNICSILIKGSLDEAMKEE